MAKSTVIIAWLCMVIHGQDDVHGADSYGFRPGSPTTTHSCSNVRSVPEELRSADVMRPKGLDVFYQKYTETYGIPVLGSSQAQDDALRRACYVLRFILAEHGPVRHMVYKLGGRLAIIAPDEEVTSIPEHKTYANSGPAYGATLTLPVSSVRGTNVLCDPSDSHKPESVELHELGHMIHLIGAKYAIPGWNDRLKDSYAKAKAKGLWANTYAMKNYEEYFAETVQSYFNDNWCVPKADGIHNEICKRSLLKDYDPQVFGLIAELFPCNNPLLARCNSTQEQEEQQSLQMDCVPYVPPQSRCTDSDVRCMDWVEGFEGRCHENTNPSHKYWTPIHCRASCNTCKSTDPSCQDAFDNCPGWAAIRECQKNPLFMNVNCAYSCKKCTAKM